MFNSLEDIGRFKAKYFPEGIIIDTNILILFLIGKYDSAFIEKCELLNNSNNKYSIDDFKLVEKIFTYFNKRVITPEIIAELSNLSITKGVSNDRLIPYLKTVIQFLKVAEERHQRIDCLWEMRLEVIGRFGFTDLTMLELSKQTKMPILTDDLKFYIHSYETAPIIRFQNIKNLPYQSVFR